MMNGKANRRHAKPDEGSALIMVLAFVVVSSLIVIPMLTYAVTVLRANSVSIEKREDLETVRAGARVAIADPANLFNLCSTGAVQSIPTPGSPSTESTCTQVSAEGVFPALEVPIGSAALQLGQTAITSPDWESREPAAAALTNWWDTDLLSDAQPKTLEIWMPNLPRPQSTIQDPAGHPMPSPFNCQVYFPGTYEAPLLLTGPTYFTSGTYYFEEPITVVAGANVVAGFGIIEACLDESDNTVPSVGDLQAALDMDAADRPARFNIDGLGATFLFGDNAKLTVDNSITWNSVAAALEPNTSNLKVQLKFNQRYVREAEDGGARISIASINGTLDEVTSVVGPTDITDVLYVPESQVIVGAAPDGTPILESASSNGLVPSSADYTPAPRAPLPPTITSAIPLREPGDHSGHVHGAAYVQWAAPTDSEAGGSTITEYEVYDGNGVLRCQTDGALECIIDDLPRDYYDETHVLTLEATNDVGTSDPSAPVSFTVMAASDRIIAPAAPTNVVVDQVDGTTTSTPESAWISWDAPALIAAGGQYDPFIQGYEVRAFRRYVDPLLGTEYFEDTTMTCGTERFRNDDAPTECIIEGLPALDTTPGAGPEITPAIPAIPPPPAIPVTPAVPAVNGTYEGYVFRVTARTTVPETHNSADPLLSPVSSDSTPVINVFDGTGTATPAGANVVPVAPTYIPEPLIEILLANPSPAEVSVAGYIGVPQSRIEVTNPHPSPSVQEPRVRLIGGSVAASFGVPDAGAAGTTVGFEDSVILQRTIRIVTKLTNGSRHESALTMQINANGADVAVNSWVTQ